MAIKMDFSDLETYLKAQESAVKLIFSLANTDDLTHMELNRVPLQYHARMGAIATNALQVPKSDSASASVSFSSSTQKRLSTLPSSIDEINLDLASTPSNATNANQLASSSPPRRSKRREPAQSVFSRTYRPITALTKREKTLPKPSTSTSSSTFQSIKTPVLPSSKSKRAGLPDSDQFLSPSTPIPKLVFNPTSKTTTIPTPPSTNFKRSKAVSFASDKDKDEPPSPTPQLNRRYNTGSANPNHGTGLYVPALNTSSSSSRHDLFTVKRGGVRGELGGASGLFGGTRVRSIASSGNKKTGEKRGIVDLISDSSSDDDEAEEDRRTEWEIEANEVRGGVGRSKIKGKGKEMSASAKGVGELDDGEDDLEPVKKKFRKEFEGSDSDDDHDKHWRRRGWLVRASKVADEA